MFSTDFPKDREGGITDRLDGATCWCGTLKSERGSMYWVEVMPSGLHAGHYHVATSVLSERRKITTRHAVPAYAVAPTIDHQMRDFGTMRCKDIMEWEKVEADKMALLGDYVQNEPKLPRMIPAELSQS